jgi:hypothetical protein
MPGIIEGDRLIAAAVIVRVGITDQVGSYSHKLSHCDRFFHINSGFLTASECGLMLAFTILSHFLQGDRAKNFRPPLDKPYYSMLWKHKQT